MTHARHNLRSLLLAIGMPDFNATQCIRVMLQPPHATDPDMPPVVLITRQIQLCLNKMGAGVPVSGMLDQDTDDFLYPLCGDGYLTRPWYMVVEAVISAMNRGSRLSRAQPNNGALEQQSVGEYVGVGGDGPFGLPAVPGGIVTYGVGAYLLYRWLSKPRTYTVQQHRRRQKHIESAARHIAPIYKRLSSL